MPDSQVIVVMNRFKSDLLARERRVQFEMAQRWLEIERALEGQIAALAQEFAGLAAEGRTPNQRDLFAMERYQRLLAQLQIELRNYTNYAESLIEGQQHAYAQLAIQHAATAIDASITTRIGAQFDRLPIEAVEHMVGLAGDGSPLRQLLVDSWPDAAQGLTQELIRSTALGVNPRETARRMANETTRTLNRMLNVARSEQMRVYRHTGRQAYVHSKVIEGYYRIATRDLRVCAACILDDGHFYRLDEVMAEHPSGRCSQVPKIIGMKAPQWEKGPDWFRRQQPATQQSILGKGRYAAWQDGKFDLDSVVQTVRNDVWGDSIQVRPLRELTNG